MVRISGMWLSPFLTKFGKRFGIDAHYFAKNSSFTFLGHILAVIRGIVTGYLVVHFFDKNEYGEYQFILSAMGLFAVFGLHGLVTSVSRAWARQDAFDMNRVSIHQLKVSLIGSFLLLCCIPFLGYYGKGELWHLFIGAAIIFPLPTIAAVRFGGFTIGRARFDISLRASVVWSILVILATLLIILLYQSPLLLLFANTAIPPLVYFWYCRKIKPPKEEGTTNTDGIIRYGWQMTLSTLPSEIVWYIDKMLISYFLGLGQLATFSVALLIPEQMKILLKQFFPVMFSKQAEKGDTYERRRKLCKAVLVSVCIFAIGIMVYIAVCPFLIPFLFPQYDSKVVILLTSVSAATLIFQPMTLLSQYLEAQKMVRELWVANLAAALSFLLSILICIPLYGLLGAVIARGIFRFVYVGISWWYVVRSPLQVHG